MIETVDTLFKSQSLVVTKEYMDIVSYVNISSLFQTVFLLVLGILVVSILNAIYVYINSISSTKTKIKWIMKGYYAILVSSWLGDVYLMISIESYREPYMLIVITATIILYTLFRVLISLGKLGFAPSMFFRIIGAVTKSIMHKNTDSLSELVEEIGNSEEAQTKVEEKTSKLKDDIMNKLPAILFILVFISCARTINVDSTQTPKVFLADTTQRKITVQEISEFDSVVSVTTTLNGINIADKVDTKVTATSNYKKLLKPKNFKQPEIIAYTPTDKDQIVEATVVERNLFQKVLNFVWNKRVIYAINFKKHEPERN